MMMYANLFSSGFTALGLLLNLEIVEVARFVNLNPEVAGVRVRVKWVPRSPDPPAHGHLFYQFTTSLVTT